MIQNEVTKRWQPALFVFDETPGTREQLRSAIDSASGKFGASTERHRCPSMVHTANSEHSSGRASGPQPSRADK